MNLDLSSREPTRSLLPRMPFGLLEGDWGPRFVGVYRELPKAEGVSPVLV